MSFGFGQSFGQVSVSVSVSAETQNCGFGRSLIFLFQSKTGLLAGCCEEKECTETMIEVWNNDKYLIDPHTSVAIKVAKEFQRKSTPMLIASTAHYSKFVDECKEVWEQIKVEVKQPAKHEGIEACKSKQIVHQEIIGADYEGICAKLESFVTDYFGAIENAQNS